MDGPCLNFNSAPVWLMVALAIISHIRGTIVALVEAKRFFELRRSRRRAKKFTWK